MDKIFDFFSHPVACLVEGFTVGVSLGYFAATKKY